MGRSPKNGPLRWWPLMFHVYVLRSEKTGRMYVGSTDDVDRRVTQHNAGHRRTFLRWANLSPDG